VRLRRALAALALVLAILLVVFRATVGAQARAFVVLSTTLETPVLTWTAKHVTRTPHAQERVVAGMQTTIVRPGGSPPWPAVVFVNGATRQGRMHPDVQRLAQGLARAGFLVYVPDLPGLRFGQITERTLAATVAVARAAAASREARQHRIGFVSVSVGTSLALDAAANDSLRTRVSAVAGIAPYAHLRDVIRLATTGITRTGEHYDVDPYVGLAVGRSLVAGLRPSAARDRLLRRLLAVPDEDADPLAALPLPDAGDLRPVLALLLNRNPARFARLYAALPAQLRAGLSRLSPLARAGRIDAEIELASARTDRYFPVSESQALVRAAPHARITVTGTLDHAIPKPSLRDLGELFAFDAWVVRSLRELRS